MDFKTLFLLLLVLSNISSQKTYLDNESLYSKYYPSYSNSNFKIRSIKTRSDFLNGLDCSMVSIIEENGGAYFDFDGKEKDFFQLIKENGINLVRIRLWNNYKSETSVKGGGCLDVEIVENG